MHLAGHDWGGVVGWQVASRYPHLLQSWTALSTPHPLALDAVLAQSEEQRKRFGYILLFRQPGAAEQSLLGGERRGTARDVRRRRRSRSRSTRTSRSSPNRACSRPR